MKHDNDSVTTTPEKAIKLRAWHLIAEMIAVGVPQRCANLAALQTALQLKAQFVKVYTGTDKTKRLEQFELLEKGISGYLPMPKDPQDMSDTELDTYIKKHTAALSPFLKEQFDRLAK